MGNGARQRVSGEERVRRWAGPSGLLRKLTGMNVGKKKDQDDLAADFFGDADWMDDEEDEEEDEDSEESEHLPVAPSPEAPPTGEVSKADAAKAADWADKISAAPGGQPLSNAPTLHFSAVPTIPPMDEKETDVPLPTEDLPTLSGPLPGAEAVAPTEEAPRPAPEEHTEPTAVVPPVAPPPPAPEGMPTVTPDDPPAAEPAPDAEADAVEAPEEAEAEDASAAEEEAAEAPAEADEGEDSDAVDEEEEADEADDADDDQDSGDEAADEAVFGDDVGGEEEPLVHTHDPAPHRVTAPPSAAAPSAAPPAEPIERWEPQGDAEAWAGIANALVRAAATSGEKGPLLQAAGRIHRDRLGDPKAASTLFRDAESAGLSDGTLLRELATTLRAAGRAAEAVPVLERAAANAEGLHAAELFAEAADIARDADPHRALELARKATEAAPEDYVAWSGLRDLLAETGASADERVAVADTLAGLSSGWAAAEARLEAAGALLGEERVADAVSALKAGREAAADHGTVFVVLEDGLSELGEHVGLAELYTSEATREGTEDAGWWWLQAARAQRAAGDEAADGSYAKAVEAGFLLAERERQAAALQGESWQLLADSLQREAEGLTGTARAYALMRLGDVRERKLGDSDGALEAYRGAVAADPMAAPAADGVARLLARSESHDELRALWASRLDEASEETRAPMQFRMAEVCEAGGDEEGAAKHYREALGSGSAAIERGAGEGLARVLHRGERWSELAEHWASQASAANEAVEKADLLYRAATVGTRDAQEDGIAVDRLREVLALEPTHRGALFELCMRLEALGDWAGLAQTLDDAGDASADASWRAVLKYRAARVRMERGVDPEKIRHGLEGAVAAEAGFLPALWALRQAASDDPGAQCTLYRTQSREATTAAGASWAGFAASLLAEDGGHQDLSQILEREPDNPGALAAMACQVLARGDKAALIDLWKPALAGEPTGDRARLALTLAALLRDEGHGEEASSVLSDLADSPARERPLRAAARVAESVGAWDVAAAFLGQLEHREDRMQQARILGRRKGDVDAALPLYRTLLEGHADDADVAFGAAITAARAGDTELLARAHHQVAKTGDTGASRAASARWAATLFERSGKHELALECWRIDLELRPDSDAAWRGAERSLRALGDVDGLVAHYDGRGAPLALATALSEVGADTRAAEVLAAALDEASPRLPVQLALEQARAAAEDWQGVYDLLTARRETMDEEEQRTIDARRRWILAEKLADTDAAWELYRKLHEDAPDDREVTEALARIAGARGETALAIQYLKELAESSEDEGDAARYQRRVGEVYEHNDDVASARQAYLDALDHQRDDREALDGLRRLAEKEEDWAGLIQVHQREAGIADGERKLELKRAIARVTEERLDDPAVAIDAWRAVLELSDGDEEALQHLMSLAEAQGEWGTYIEVGRQLADRARGAERTALLRKLGIACQDEQFDRDDAIRFFEQAISSETPDVEAARRLEQLYRGSGDWGGAIRALVVQAEVTEDPTEKCAPLERAARLELEVRHDRTAAAEFYERILAIDENHVGALRFLASHLFSVHRYETARDLCARLEPVAEEGLDLDDFDNRIELASFYYAYAEILHEAGEKVEALPRYARALELNPSHQASLERIGPLYTAAGEWKKAEGVYRQLLQLTGGQGDKKLLARVYSRLGVVERELGNLDKAYKRFNKALELHPNHVGALKGMAMVLEDREDWTNLLNVFNNIIHHATVPEDVVDAYMTKGRVLDEKMERPDKAAQHYQRSLDFDPKQPTALLRMAELAARRDAWDEARVFAEKGLALDNEALRPALLLVLAGAMKAAGEDEAEARLDEAKAAGDKAMKKALGKAPLDDLASLRQVVFDQLPR